ncbi:MAG: ABC transporter ATP-binding protein [Burkholderiaceae bacterium]|nr:ABC transporter ATP-binding protein [Desulfobacterales bacterium]MDP3139366.1 ABC transporter ATP-binding protein [Burkholderiaceae bacterium]
MNALLEISGLEASYGYSKVLHGLDLQVAERSTVTVLGANGAGKTTTLRAISGMVRTGGSIRFDGHRIDGFSPEKVAKAGIAHVPDGRGTLTELTVEENLQVGAYTQRDRASVKRDFDRVYGYFPRLKERRLQQAGTLSGGEQQMLAIGRALMMRPRLLLMDEPSFGLAPLIIKEIFGIIKLINQEDHVSVLLVEQNVGRALEAAQFAYLLETGRLVLSGRSELLSQDERVRHSYLGL